MTRESPFYEWLHAQRTPEEIAQERAAVVEEAKRTIQERDFKIAREWDRAYNGRLVMMSDADLEREKQRVLLGL